MRSTRKRTTLGRKARLGAPIAATIALGAIAAAPAHATVSPVNPPEAGENITVFHNIDFVATFGTGDIGDRVSIDIIRDGHIVGSSSGPLVDAEGQPGLEANHGPAGAPQPGDCWTGHTPNIGPGDVVRVTNHSKLGEVDEVTVDNIRFETNPDGSPVAPVLDPLTQQITVKGFASRADGTPIDIDFLDSAEFLDTSKFRGPPDDVIRTPGTDDGFTMIYDSPYELERNEIYPTLEQRRASLLGLGHGIGFGHVEVLPLESMLVDGMEDVHGPALGCEGSPAQVNSALALPGSINSASTGLSLSGGKEAGVSGVEVTITDGAPGTTAVVLNADEGGESWSAALAGADLEAVKAMADGALTATVAFPGGTETTSRVLNIDKDLVAPVVTADLAPGNHVGARSLALGAGAGEIIEYSRDGGTTWTEYFGEIGLGLGTHSITVRATDEAGNVSVPVTWTYVITNAPVVIQEVIRQAPAPAQAAAAPSQPAGPAPVVNEAPSLRSMVVSSFRLASRTSLRAARTRGVEVAYQVPAGADAVTFSVFRKGATAAARKAVVKRTVRVSGSGRRTIRIRSAKFKAGRYSLEITPSQGGQKGGTVKRSFQIRK